MENHETNNQEKVAEQIQISELNRSERRKTLFHFSILLLLIIFLTSLSTCCFTKSTNAIETQLSNKVEQLEKDADLHKLQLDSLQNIIATSNSVMAKSDTLIFKSLQGTLEFMENYRLLNLKLYSDTEVDFRNELTKSAPKFQSLQGLITKDKINDLADKANRIALSSADNHLKFNEKIEKLNDEIKTLKGDKQDLKDEIKNFECP